MLLCCGVQLCLISLTSINLAKFKKRFFCCFFFLAVVSACQRFWDPSLASSTRIPRQMSAASWILEPKAFQWHENLHRRLFWFSSSFPSRGRSSLPVVRLVRLWAESNGSHQLHVHERVICCRRRLPLQICWLSSLHVLGWSHVNHPPPSFLHKIRYLYLN